jgi:hypothetical protein
MSFEFELESRCNRQIINIFVNFGIWATFTSYEEYYCSWLGILKDL